LVDEAAPPTATMPPAAGSPGLGLLAYNVPAKINQVTDGLSKTIAYAESGGRPYLYRSGRLIETFPEKRVNSIESIAVATNANRNAPAWKPGAVAGRSELALGSNCNII
jgi:hypothetical protein